jgi:hypothetical protein
MSHTLRTLFSNFIHDASLFLGGMLIGVALGIIATLIGVTAYMSRGNDEQ